MGFDKTFAELVGRPVIAHAIAAFETADAVGNIILVGRAERIDELKELVAREGFSKVGRFVAGGRERQDSVARGLGEVGAADYVAVHDAARPLVRPEQIERVLRAAQVTGAAALAAPVRDTLKRADGDYWVRESVSREGMFTMETPQIFSTALLREAFARVVADRIAITDEVSAVEYLGRPVRLVPNEEANFKITYPADLRMAEYVLSLRQVSGTKRGGLEGATP